MTVGLLDDTADSKQMLDSEIEEHKLHRLVSVLVILLEGLISLLLHLGDVS
jgi:hypothetical protein